MSSPFCSGCSRIRVTADGKLKNCLFSPESEDFDLRTHLRSNKRWVTLIDESYFLQMNKVWIIILSIKLESDYFPGTVYYSDIIQIKKRKLIKEKIFKRWRNFGNIFSNFGSKSGFARRFGTFSQNEKSKPSNDLNWGFIAIDLNPNWPQIWILSVGANTFYFIPSQLCLHKDGSLVFFLIFRNNWFWCIVSDLWPWFFIQLIIFVHILCNIIYVI